MIRVKVKVPSAKFNKTSFVSSMRKMGNELATRVKGTYDNEVMDTWESKANFVKDVKASQALTSVKVKTDSNVYRYLTRGTEPHTIEPKEDNPTGLLSYQVDFTPKTIVGTLKSKPGGKSGAYISVPIVEHPGNEARNYEELIIDEQLPWIRDYFTKVLLSTIEVKR